MKTISILFIVISCSVGLSQNNNSPTVLLQKLHAAKEDTVITNLYLELGKFYYEDQFDSAYYYFNKGLQIARQQNLKSEEGNLLITKARVMVYEGLYLEAIDTLKKALLVLQNENRLIAIANAYTSIGVVFYNKSEYDSCKYYWNKSLQIYNQMNDSSGIATINANIGVVNYVQGNAEKALKHYLKALEIREKLKVNKGIASLYMKIALIYQNHFEDNIESNKYVSQAVKLYELENNKLGKTKALINLGNNLELLDSTDKAINIYYQALEVAEEIGNKRLLSTIYSILGNHFLKQSEYRKALGYLYKSRDFNKEMGQIRELSTNLSRIGDIFYELADYNTSLSYYQKSLDLLDELGIHGEKAYRYFAMARTAAEMNNYKLAYEYSQNYAIEKDSALQQENKELLTEMEAKYANQQKEQQITYLTQEKRLKEEQLDKSLTIRNLLIGMALLVLAIAILFFQRFRQKTAINRELRKRNEEIKEANDEINQNSIKIERYNSLLKEKNKVIQLKNAEMEENNKTKDRIFSIIGHDLRSPMASLQTSLKLLETKNFTKEKIAHIYRLMENDLISAIDLLENLLMWAKNQENRVKLIREEQSITPVIEKAIKSTNSKANNKGISVEFFTCKDDLAYFDHQMISTVLRNLLVNAIKFTKYGGDIKVNIESGDLMLKVAVSDTGIGMDEATIEKIKQKGNYHSQPGTNREKGSGLGLSLCFDIVEMHKGYLTIESNLDKGSTFSFTIPKKIN